MELYHITKVDFLPGILAQGLLVNSGNNGFVKKSYIKEYHKKYGMQPIFLTNDIGSVIETDLGKKTFLKEFVVLKIQSETLQLEGEYDYLVENWEKFFVSKDSSQLDKIKESSSRRFVCKQNIGPQLISYNLNYGSGV